MVEVGTLDVEFAISIFDQSEFLESRREVGYAGPGCQGCDDRV